MIFLFEMIFRAKVQKKSLIQRPQLVGAHMEVHFNFFHLEHQLRFQSE